MMPLPTFERTAGRTLDECSAIATQRGGEYADSWSLETAQYPFIEAILSRFGVKLDKEQMRLVAMSALVDVKISRITSGGPHKRDNYVDGINYMAALATLREEYEAKRPPGGLGP